MPTLILHGADDQFVPIANSALKSSQMIRNTTFKIYKGAPHGFPATLKDKVNADLLRFLRNGTIKTS